MLWFKTRTFRCNSHKITVWRNPNDAVPIYVSQVTAAAKGSFDLAEGEFGKVSGEFKERLIGISNLVHSATETFLMEFRVIYQYYSESPCQREDYFQHKLSELLKERRRFDLTRLHLSTIVDLSAAGATMDNLLERFDLVVKTLSLPTTAHEMLEELAAVPKLIEDWERR